MEDGKEAAPYLPLDGGRFRLMMGLMPLALEQWIEIDHRFTAALAAKRALLEARHSEVFAALDEAAAPAAELVAILADHLARYAPARFRREGHRLLNLAAGEEWDLVRSDLHPLDLAGRLVQEDLCLMLPGESGYRLVAASLCSPAHWRLADKLGRPLLAIHAPVPGYAAKLAQPVDRFFTSLKPEKPVWRLNWGIQGHPEPFQPVRLAGAGELTAANAGEQLWLRVERQTLRRLPVTGAVIFTIRTHITRLDRALASAAAAAELAASVRQMPAETQAYKNIAAIRPTLLSWLDARAARG